MCAIVGALVWNITTGPKLREVDRIINHLIDTSHERGRDGRGVYVNEEGARWPGLYKRDTTRQIAGWGEHRFFGWTKASTLLCNLRAEPTTEYVFSKREEDQQPYIDGGWAIVHNGTISNDKALRSYTVHTSIDSAAIVEDLASAQLIPNASPDTAMQHFLRTIRKLKGSYAVLANHKSDPGHIMVACNYRPIWYAVGASGVFFASARHYFPSGMCPKMVTPYTAMSFYNSEDGLEIHTYDLRQPQPQGAERALVVCSGGLDSVVAATYAQRELGYEIELIHFLYGSRAEGPEVKAVQAVAEALEVPCTLFPLAVYDKSDSPLLDPDSAVAGGEQGAEFAHEWVPARNLLLLSVATAYAEAKGFSVIVLGNNLEEAGAYPDNEPEFIARFNDMLPFAVADGKRMRVIMPVGNLMKHEIVALGKEVDAPLHLTWSCYRAGALHCGTCGPCYMRRTAFQINQFPEVIAYHGEH